MAQPGRALGLGPRGREFKSLRPDQNTPNVYTISHSCEWEIVYTFVSEGLLDDSLIIIYSMALVWLWMICRQARAGRDGERLPRMRMSAVAKRQPNLTVFWDLIYTAFYTAITNADLFRATTMNVISCGEPTRCAAFISPVIG